MTAVRPLSSVDLQSMIDHNPLIVASTMRVQEAIARMSETGSSYVLVVRAGDAPSSGSGLMGILTEHDLVRIWTQPTPLDQLPIQAVMSQPVITLKASDLSDTRVALTLFQQHQIHHLPVLEEGDRLLGVLRQSSLTEQLAQAVVQLESQVADAAEVRAWRDRYELQKNAAHQHALISAIPDLIMRINRAGIHLEFIAPPNFRVLGNLPDLVGTHVAESLPPELAEKRMEFIQRALQTNSIQIYEQNLSIGDITQIEEVRIVPYSQDEVLALVRDISERKRSEAEHKRMEAERQAAEAALQANEQFLRSIYEGVEQAIFTLDVLADGELRYVAFNPAAEQISGKSTEQIRGNIPGEKVRQHYLDCLQAGTSLSYEECLIFQDQPTWWLTTLNPIRDASSRIWRIVGTSTNITQRKQAEALLELQNTVLERIAKSEPLPEILDTLLRALEMQLVNGFCSIMLCDRAGKLHCEAATRLPKPYLQACEGIAIGEGVGSCGTAAFRGEPVIVSDIATDPLWQNFKGVALEHGLRACWSVPVIASNGQVLGTFAVYHRETYTPDAHALEVVTLAVNIAGIAIEREQATQALHQLNQELEHRVEERTLALQKSEERWQLALQGSNDGIFDWDLRTNQIFYSSRWKAMRGFADHEIGNSLEECTHRMHPEDRKRVKAAIAAHLAGQTQFVSVEYRTRCKDGSYLWVLARGQAIWNGTGQAIRLSGSDTDITQRKQAEEALRESQRRYATLAAAAPVAIFRFDGLLNCVYVNDRWSEMTGRPLEAALGQGWVEALHPDDRDLLMAKWVEMHAQASPGTQVLNGGEGRHLRPDGSINWFYVQVAREMDADGTVIGYIGTLTDITHRKQAEIALQKSEQRYRALMEGASDAILLADSQGNLIEANKSAEILLGYSREELTRLHMSQIHPPEALEAVRQHFSNVIQNNLGPSLENLVLRKDGSQVPVDITGSRIEVEGEQIAQGIFRDVSERARLEAERKQAENALRESQQFLQTVLDTFPLSVFWKDRDSVYLGCNRNFLQDAGLVSIAEIIGKTDYDLPWSQTEADAYRADDQQVMNTDAAKLGIIETLNKFDGSQIWLETNKLPLHTLMGEVIGVLGTYQDISERKRLEAELAESEAKFRHLVEGGHDLIWAQDTEGRFTYLSPQFQTLFGWEPQEWIGKLSIDLVHPDDLSHGENIGESNREFRHRHRDGHYVWVSTTPTPILNAEGFVVGRQGTLTDISDRKQAEEALRLSEERFRNAFDNTAVGMCLVSPAGRFLKVNAALCSFLGYSEAELLERMCQDITYPEDLAKNLESVKQIIAGATPSYHTEKRYFTKQGQVVWGWVSVSLIRDADAQPLYFVVQIQDISEKARLEAKRKQSEEALRLSEERFRNAFDNTAVGMCLVSLEGHYLKANAALCQFLGYSEAQLLEIRFQDITHPDDLPVNLELVGQILTGKIQSYHLEKRYFSQSGQVVWGLLSVSLIQDADAQPLYFVAQIQDITERKRLEQEQSRLLALLEGSTDYILIADMAGVAIWNNAALKQLRGLASDATVVQQRLTDYHPQWAVEVLEQQAVPTAIATGSWLGETVVLDAAGQEIPVSQLLLAHKSLQGEVEFFSTIMRDVRVRKEYEQRLEQTNAELLRATRLKDEFLANMSHELRTPLTAILGMSELLKENIFGELNAKQRQYIEIISNSGKHLLSLINDILDVSKISAGKLELDISSVPVTDLCTSSLEFIKQEILKKQIQLTTTLPTNLGNIDVDERRIRQVLINLLSNAVKFTPSGGCVTLEVRVQDSGNDRLDSTNDAAFTFLQKNQAFQESLNPPVWLVFSVCDTGIGIASEDQAKLFQPFVQIDSSLNRKYEGTGLGLALVKQIVELHGGAISLTSQLGQGTCLTVRLPYCYPTESIVLPPSPQMLDEDSPMPTIVTEPMVTEALPTDAPLILLAEDNQSTIDLLSSYLEACGYRILIAHNGQEAMDLAQAHCPELILMDIQMPQVSGLEAIQTIRQNSQLAQVPIIALTALAMEGDRDRCLAAGANDYFTKPVKLRKLSGVIQQFLGAKEESE